jgi:peptide-methionine (S)-S-oxide reductase
MLKNLGISSIFIVLIHFFACAQHHDVKTLNESKNMAFTKLDTITLGAGCFWCVEAIFQQLRGVHSVESGYSGGHVKNPTYKDVCTGLTGHAEVCQIAYDPSIISFVELIEVFWKTHDPTTLNRQGNDVGPQYRSVVFYHTDNQKKLTEQMKSRLDRAGIWKDPIVTEIVPFEKFYKAENYHQEYYFQNLSQPYCSAVITPKLEKFRKVFADKLNESK